MERGGRDNLFTLLRILYQTLQRRQGHGRAGRSHPSDPAKRGFLRRSTAGTPRPLVPVNSRIQGRGTDRL